MITKDSSAFPVDDVGLQNAVKQQLGLSKKPTADDIGRFSDQCNDWRTYAAFYL
jgi:DNA-3-methyladenine glycosylase II